MKAYTHIKFFFASFFFQEKRSGKKSRGNEKLAWGIRAQKAHAHMKFLLLPFLFKEKEVTFFGIDVTNGLFRCLGPQRRGKGGGLLSGKQRLFSRLICYMLEKLM